MLLLGSTWVQNCQKVVKVHKKLDPRPRSPTLKKTLELQMLPPGLALNFAWFFPLKALQRLGGECGWRPVVYLHNHYFMKILFSSKNFSVRCFIKHCKRCKRPKALSTLTHSTPSSHAEASKSFEILVKLQLGLVWQRARKTKNNFEKSKKQL